LLKARFIGHTSTHPGSLEIGIDRFLSLSFQTLFLRLVFWGRGRSVRFRSRPVGVIFKRPLSIRLVLRGTLLFSRRSCRHPRWRCPTLGRDGLLRGLLRCGTRLLLLLLLLLLNIVRRNHWDGWCAGSGCMLSNGNVPQIHLFKGANDVFVVIGDQRPRRNGVPSGLCDLWGQVECMLCQLSPRCCIELNKWRRKKKKEELSFI
jgi:hypothetical protein